LEIAAQDGLNIVGFQPFLRLTDTNAGKAEGRIASGSGDISFYPNSEIGKFVPMTVKNGGNVGIGTPNPSSKLEIAAQDAVSLSGFQLFLTLKDTNSGTPNARIQNANGDLFIFTGFVDEQANPAAMTLKQGTGNVGIGTPNPSTLLEVSGESTFNSNVTVNTGTLTMNGGDIRLPGADYAEQFDLAGAQQLEPGTVVVIDENGALRESSAAYDRKVAGVVSGAGEYRPGIVLGGASDREDRALVAVVGKVYCKVDARHGPIELGDLLTTSPTPGHAMRAGDPTRAFGAVIGKALRPMSDGCGLLPMLVALQ
jgi:hypothetical protein